MTQSLEQRSRVLLKAVRNRPDAARSRLDTVPPPGAATGLCEIRLGVGEISESVNEASRPNQPNAVLTAVICAANESDVLINKKKQKKVYQRLLRSSNTRRLPN